MTTENAPLYYANNIFKLTSIGSEKFKTEDDGFDGFVSRCDLLKARTNKSGQWCELVYNQVTGFDPVMSLFRFATMNGAVDGRNPYRFFKDYKDLKFDSRKFNEIFNEKPEIREALFKSTLPILSKQLKTEVSSTNKLEDYISVVSALSDSQQDEEFDKEAIVIEADEAGMFGSINTYRIPEYMLEDLTIEERVYYENLY